MPPKNLTEYRSTTGINSQIVFRFRRFIFFLSIHCMSKSKSLVFSYCLFRMLFVAMITHHAFLKFAVLRPLWTTKWYWRDEERMFPFSLSITFSHMQSTFIVSRSVLHKIHDGTTKEYFVVVAHNLRFVNARDIESYIALCYVCLFTRGKYCFRLGEKKTTLRIISNSMWNIMFMLCLYCYECSEHIQCTFVYTKYICPLTFCDDSLKSILLT